MRRSLAFVTLSFSTRSLAHRPAAAFAASVLRPSAHRRLTAAATTTAEDDVRSALATVAARVDRAVAARGAGEGARLVVVSKTKPVELLQAAYGAGARHFGENYVQELVDKAPLMPGDVAWHFIGHLQSNKCKKLVRGVPNLAVVETVDSLKLAKKLDAACVAAGRPPLPIYLQVNTSAEGTKSGLADGADGAAQLALAVSSGCPRLTVAGLMTIGAPGDGLESFNRLAACRAAAAAALGVRPSALALSMGMSGDFEEAISRGSTSVRVGSSIFGARDYPADAAASSSSSSSDPISAVPAR